MVSIWSFKLLNNVWRLNTHLRRNTMSVLTKGSRLSNRLFYPMEQIPSWENNRFSASQEIPPNFTEPEVLLPYSWPLPILSQISPLHVPPYYFLKIHFNIILPSITGPFKWSFSPQVSPPKPCYAPLLSPIPATCRVHLILLDLINKIIFYWQFRPLTHHYAVFFTPLLPPHSSAQIFSSVTYSQTLSAPSMWASKFHTHSINRQTYSYVSRLSLFWKKLHPALRIVQNK